MNPQELNQRVEAIINMANNGINPQSVMQQMFNGFNTQSPQYNTAMTQMRNMAGSRSMPEFYIQILKQNGLTEQNAQGLARLMGIK
jgi:hypothetical protein